MGLFRSGSKGRTTVNYRRIAAKHHKRKCAKCGTIYGLHVHHRNGNDHDNRPKNLQWLCEAHHLAVHGKRLRKPRYYVMSQKGNKLRVRKVWDEGRNRRHGCGCGVLLLFPAALALLIGAT